MSDECEFKEICEAEEDVECLIPEEGLCLRYRAIKRYLNSPQFQERFVDRESLVEDIERKWHDSEEFERRPLAFKYIIQIIRTHNKEQSP